MPKFSVTAIFDCSKFLGTVEAETLEEAKDIAHKKAEDEWADHMMPTLCHQCADIVELADFQEFVIHEE